MSACRHNTNIAAVKSKRGRPPGLKNKPKPPATTSTSYVKLQTHMLKISAGGDVVESITALSRGCLPLGVSVLSASGRIVIAVLRQASAYPSTLTFQGSFDLLSMTATFLPGGGIRSLVVTLGGPNGQVVSGVVAGQLVAADIVTVIVATFALPAFHRMDKIDINPKHMLPVVKEDSMLHKCLAEIEQDLGLHKEPVFGGCNREKQVDKNRLEHNLKEFEQYITMPMAIGSASTGGDVGVEKKMDLNGGCVGDV